MKNLLPGGLWPVMLTPFDDDNQPDLEALSRLTEFYIEAGAQGLFANCLSSEMFQLTSGERLAITRKVREVAGDRVPVIATGTFGKDTDENSEFIKKVYDTGVRAVVINTNQIVSRFESNDTLKFRIENLLNQTGEIPLGVYECPVPYKRLVTASLMEWMANTGRFLYLKDTTCDMEAMNQKIHVAKGTSLGLYNAHTPTAYESLLGGAHGISPIAANFYPELFTYLVENYDSEEKAGKIRKLSAALSMMDEVVHKFYPYSAKVFLKKRGMAMPLNTRNLGSDLSTQDMYQIDAMMVLFQKLMEELEVEYVKF